MSGTVTGRLDLGGDLDVDHAVLGAEAVVDWGVPVRLVVPSFQGLRDDETDSVGLSSPFPDLPSSLSWGWAETDEGPWVVRGLAVEMEADAASALAGELDERSGRWLDAFNEWVAVVSQQPRYSGPPVEYFWQGRGVLRLWSAGADNVEELALNRGWWFRAMPGSELSRPQWDAIHEVMRQGRRPPDAYLLLRDAQEAFLRGQLRRSVIECATAVEVTLSDLLRSDLEQTGGKRAEPILRQVRGVTARLNLARQFGLVAGHPELDARVFVPRNQAVHAGADPTREVAAAALASAREFVAAYVPCAVPLAGH